MSKSTWKSSRLEQVVSQWIVGSTPRRANESFFSLDNGLPWVRVEDLTTRNIIKTNQYITAEGRPQVKVVEPNTVLISTAGTIGKTAIAGTQLATNQAIQALFFNEKVVLNAYAYYYLTYKSNELNAMANAFVIRNLTKKSLSEFVIEYPSIEEQRHIVSVLENAEQYWMYKKDSVQLLSEFLPSFFYHVFGEDADNTFPLRNLLKGYIKPANYKESDYSSDGYSVVQNFKGDVLGDISYYQKITPSPKMEILQKNDILLKVYSAEAPQIVIVDKLDTPCIAGSNVLVLRPNPTLISPGYLLSWLKCTPLQQLYKGSMQKRLDINQLLELKVPMHDAQEQYEKQFWDFISLQTYTTRAEQAAGGLFSSLLQAAFNKQLSEKWRALHTDEFLTDTWIPEDIIATQIVRETSAMLPPGLEQLVALLSPFQKSVLNRIIKEEEPFAIHVLYKKLPKKVRQNSSIQDAIIAISLFVQLGLVEKAMDKKILFPSYATPQNDEYITDKTGNEITIQFYQLSADLQRKDSHEIVKVENQGI